MAQIQSYKVFRLPEDEDRECACCLADGKHTPAQQAILVSFPLWHTINAEATCYCDEHIPLMVAAHEKNLLDS